LKELILSHNPLWPSKTSTNLPTSLRLLDLSHSPTLLNLDTLKSLLSPHPHLLVLDLTNPQAKTFMALLPHSLPSLKVWFPRLQRVISDGRGVRTASCFENFGEMAFGVGKGDEVVGAVTISRSLSPKERGNKQNNTPRAVINLKEITKETGNLGGGEVKRQLQFGSSQKKLNDSFEIGSVNESKLPESPPPIPIMNDYLKYFNHFSK
jgi:hypothetical protein